MKLIGSGRTADVYYHEGKAIKVYHSNISDDFIAYEYKVGQLAKPLGPSVLDYEQIDSRKGISFEYLQGDLLSEHLKNNLSRIRSIGKSLGHLHQKIHERDVDLISQDAYFEKHITDNPLLDLKTQEKLIKHLHSLQTGNKFCHGDYHLENILITDTWRVIDWTNAYSGNPLSDVARTYMILSSPIVKKHIPYYLKPFIDRIMSVLKRHYLKGYHTSYRELRPWLPIIYAARLNEAIPEEKSWLLCQLFYEMKKQHI